jgi:hypothetical protein
MKLQVIKNRLFSWLKKTFLYGTLCLVIFILVSLILLQVPAVQRAILNRYLSKIERIARFVITYDRINASWWDRLEVENLNVIDPEQNTMIHAGQLQINFKLTSLLKNNEINLDGVELFDGSVNLVKIAENDSARDLNINIFIAEVEKIFGGGGGQGNPPKFNIGEVLIHKTHFYLRDSLAEPTPDIFDSNNIRILIDEAQARQFKVIGDTIEFDLTSMLALEENARLPVHPLSTFFRISQRAMEFYNLQGKIGDSEVGDTLVFKYNSLADLSDFYEKVSIEAMLKNTLVSPVDLARFTGGKKVFDLPVLLNGKVTGRISRLFYQQMEVQTGTTRITGRLELDGLPAINETFINLDMKDGQVNIADLRFLFPDNVYERMKPLGKFRMNGKFTGFIDDFVANGIFDGPFGQIKSDINLKIDQKFVERSTFEGNLSLTDFNLGTFFNDTISFQQVTLSGKIKGRGLTQETTNFTLTGFIRSIGIRNYVYQNISTDARLAKELFSGKVDINDPNLQVTASGSVDIRPGHEVIRLNASIDTLFADRLGFIRQPFFIRSQLEIDTRGLQLDSLFGTVTLQNTLLKYEDESLQLDSLHFESYLTDNVRHLDLRSSYLDASLKGDFYYTLLFRDIQLFIKEVQLNVRNNKDELESYYLKKKTNGQEYITQFDLKLNHIDPLLKLYKLGLTISDGTVVEGKFFHGYTTGLQAFTQIDTLSYQGKYFYQNEVEFSGSKIADSTVVLAMLTIHSKFQELNKALQTKNLFAEAIWDKDHINFNLDIDQQGASNFVRMQSEINFLADSTRIKILPTRVHLLEKEWGFDQGNYILNKGREWAVHNVQMIHRDESILIDGYISDNKENEIRLSFTHLNLDIFNAISTSSFKGIMNGTAVAKDLYHDFYLQNDLTIRDLEVDNFLIGDVTGTNIWNQAENRFDINFTIDRLGRRTLTLQGYYDQQKKAPLFVLATLEKTNIKIIEPFLKGIFSQMDGTLSGLYRIEGTFAEPLIRGDGKIEGGKIMVDYLKTLYSFSGRLRMTPNQIIFEDFNLADAFNNKGYLDGYLTHKNYARFRINLDAAFTNFQILNTTSKDNSLFYGQGYGTGRLNMLGPLSNMKISATATTTKNTRIYIPISGTGSVEKSEFITFVSFKDTIETKRAESKITAPEGPTGITMDLNLDITPDAYAEIIFDIKAGDIIRGYGYGDIKLQLDTKGEFNMFGLYEFERGNYNFTLYDIINKEFNINKGSRISWYGDPYGGILNVSASYRQLASLAPILVGQVSETALSSPQIRRKYPAEVQLKLDGPMLSPQIQFDITAKDLPDNVTVEGEPAPVRLNFQFNAFKSLLDEQELKRQVFSLIVLRRFSPRDAFSTSGSIYNSVSELLSNQLSYWLTQVDENLEINLDLGAMDNEAFNTFQLRLSYSFLNGRLRVTREGTFANQYNRSEVANMLGDWTVDYLLTPDGKLKVKMYSRSNLNTLNNTLGAQAAVTTGISLLHTQSFNEVKDLLRFSRQKRRQALELNPEQEEAIPEENDENY